MTKQKTTPEPLAIPGPRDARVRDRGTTPGPSAN